VASHSDLAERSFAKRVLITGIDGFTGRYLAQILFDQGYEVHGTSTLNCEMPAFHLHHANLLNPSSLKTVIDVVRPTHVVHLAAISFVAHGDIEQIYRTNVVGTRNLLQALGDHSNDHQAVRCILLASSANVYGNTLSRSIDEAVIPKPANDYAVSKLAMEYMAALWSERLPITVVRPFNYTGVGQSNQFLIPKIVDAYRRRLPVLELGNIDVERDFSDVRDVVEAYRRLLDLAPQGVFNVCSARTMSLRTIVQLVQELSGHQLEVSSNPTFMRTNEVKYLCGSSQRLKSVIGHWSVRPMHQTLQWMLTG
jgi:GDP-6-deoxy-D-talose 4-dehydrogenase